MERGDRMGGWMREKEEKDRRAGESAAPRSDMPRVCWDGRVRTRVNGSEE